MEPRDQLLDQPASAIESTEQSQESTQAPSVVSQQEMEAVQQLAVGLLAKVEQLPDGDLVGQIINTALNLLRDQTNRGDIKLINSALKELRYSLKVFAPYHNVRKVSIFGSARTPADDPDYLQAVAFARGMAHAGWMVTTGAGGGIMAAGHGGAGAGASFGLAIRLPFEQTTNPYIANDPKLINFKYFFTRKLMFLRTSHAIVLFPGGFGTMDEGYEVLTLVQTGKAVPMPIVMLEHPGGDYWRTWEEQTKNHLLAHGFIGPDDLRLYKITDSVAEAMHEISHFYSNFHSVRYIGKNLALRLQHPPTVAQLQDITAHFSDIIVEGEFQVSGPLPAEHDEPVLAHLSRLVFAFNKRNFARLRRLIDYLNDLPTPEVADPA
ncbi:MAG: LOG family protein [Abitibacteriaceae bacterium]|nr:LOG family protein [Abditibacteriaceae bacterium]